MLTFAQIIFFVFVNSEILSQMFVHDIYAFLYFPLFKVCLIHWS